MFTGPVGPVEVFFYWPEAVFVNFYWPGTIGPLVASSPDIGLKYIRYNKVIIDQGIGYSPPPPAHTQCSMLRGDLNSISFL